LTRREVEKALRKVREMMVDSLRDELMDAHGVDIDTSDWMHEIGQIKDGDYLRHKNEGAFETFAMVLGELGINQGSVGGLDIYPDVSTTLH